MSFIILAFFVSLVGVAMMLLTRVSALRRGEVVVDEREGYAGEQTPRALVIAENIRIMVILLVKKGVRVPVVLVHRSIRKVSGGVSAKIFGKKNVEQKNPASFFLKDIAEHKSALRKDYDEEG